MLRALKRFRAPLVFAFALFAPALVYRTHSRGPDPDHVVDRFVLAVTAPIQRSLVGAVGALCDVWYQYVDLVHAREAEGKLRRALGQERRRRAALEVVELENEHLRQLLDLQRRNPAHDLAAARVIGAGLDPGVDILRLDKGALQGLSRGLAVVSGAGLVGRLLNVAWTTAELQVIGDPRVSVPAKVFRTGARGRLSGRGRGADFRLVLSEVLRSDDLRPGDRVITSGLGGIYPAGIPIGVVTRLFNQEGVPHRFADVVPFVDFARLEVVSVVITDPPGVPLVTPEPLLPPALRESNSDKAAAPDRAVPPWPPDRAPPVDAGGLELDMGNRREPAPEEAIGPRP